MSKDLIREYPIDPMKMKLWEIELDMLQVFDNLCRKHNIKYFFMYGALIGVVRHEGFIPWDDDIDIGMLREDYDKFLKIASEELDDKYFLQIGLQEEGYYDVIARIRDRKSTGILRKDLYGKCNNGIFIEIYPFDYISSNKFGYLVKKKGLQLCSTLIYESVYMYEGNNLIRKIISVFCRKFIDEEKRKQLYEFINKRLPGKRSQKVETILTGYNLIFRTEDLQETLEGNFEGLKVQIPKGYDRILTESYGDYMTPPALEDIEKHHQNEVYYDPYNIYTEKEVLEAAKRFFNT